jgi:iron complex transport system substrate-binding protein
VIVLGDAAYGVSAKGVRARPGFDAILAVRLNHIYPFDDTLLSRPGPRIVDGLEQLARLLHPEVFK